MLKKRLILLLKGFCIGGSMLVPGVSGGSMAIILGVYDDLIKATEKIFKKTKNSLSFLVIFALGAVLGFLVVANPLKQLMDWNAKLVTFFFVGAVVGSIPMIFQKAKAHKFQFRSVFYIIIGLFVMWLVSKIPQNFFPTESGFAELLSQALKGFISAAAFITPGISISYMLVVMGVYEPILAAIATFDILALLPFGVGLLIGTAVCVKILSYLLTRHPKPTYLVILGFLLGSLAEIFPGLPTTFTEWGVGFVVFTAGFLAIYLLSKQEQ
ncbi:MAG: DUF368 domain-containing protein [Clostridia bacterium]|nr:DUF368 domain-containing protein [Clostridia bacterium]